MPFEIVRNDITNMWADAIVNTANPKAAAPVMKKPSCDGAVKRRWNWIWTEAGFYQPRRLCLVTQQ